MLFYCVQNTFHDWFDNGYMAVFSVLTEFVTSALFWDITRRIALIPYRRFGSNYLSDLQGSGNALGVVPGFFDP